MASQQQFYQAKLFLKTYNDAFKTLDQITGQQAELQKNQAYLAYLKQNSHNGAVRINGDNLEKGKNFENSKIRKLGLYSKDLFKTKLSGFEQAKTSFQLSQIFEKYLND